MAEKAMLFSDTEAYEKIIATKSPAQAKQFGRLAKGFKEDIWVEKREEVVVKGNSAKFSQNKKLAAFLVQTNKRILVVYYPPF